MNLKAAIANKGFRQSDVAVLLELSQSFLSLIVHGKRGISPRLQRRLRILLGTETQLSA